MRTIAQNQICERTKLWHTASPFNGDCIVPRKSLEERRAYSKKYRAENPEFIKELNRIWREKNKERMQYKSQERLIAEKKKRTEAQKRYRDSHKDKLSADGKAWREKRPTYGHEYYLRTAKTAMLGGCRTRAKKSGVPCNLTLDDIVIPDVCPVLGIPLFHQQARTLHASSPSVDRIIPALGYVRGNVRIISLRANFMKRDGTASELIRVARYVYNETQRVRREFGV